MADKENPPKELYQGYPGIIRLSGIIIPLISLALFIIGLSFEKEYNGLICILPTATFILELTAFLLSYWNIVEFDIKMRKSDTIVHLVLGTLNTLIGIIFIIIFICYEVEHKDFGFTTFLLFVAVCLVFAQGIIYLLLSRYCWSRFKELDAKARSDAISRRIMESIEESQLEPEAGEPEGRTSTKA